MIFHDDDDRRFFLKALSEACEMTGWRVHAWVLMGNHYHLFIETPEPNLVAGMSWLQNAYTRRYNVRHRAWGRVFGDRYKAILVEGESDYHYQTLMDYLHLNPCRARLVNVRRGGSVQDYPWSSLAGGYVLPPKRRAKWLAAEAGLKAFGLTDTVAGRRRMVERLDARAAEEAARKCGLPELPLTLDARCSHLRRGWYWGGQAFLEKMQRLVDAMLKQTRRPKSRGYERAPQMHAHSLEEAERCLQKGLAVAGLRAEELGSLKGSDARKVLLAELLWKRTVVSQEWLAEKLAMKSAANVCQLLRRLDRKEALKSVPKELGAFLEGMRA
jgi:REP element-mobilizing transposase RayT